MKPILFAVLVVVGITATAQKIIVQHNVFFQPGQTALMETQKAIINSIIAKLQSGQKAMVFPLTNDDIRGEAVFSDYADVQADEILNYANSLGYEGLMQRQFPCGFKGRSIAVSLSKKAPVPPLATQSLKDHYPPKPSQFFYINPHRDTVLYGKEGTVLFLEADALLTAANNVQVELKEFYQMADLMKSGMNTVSNGRMLQTGGSIYLDARDPQGHQTQIDHQKGIKTDFALDQNDPEMQVFIKDPRQEELNWIPGRQYTLTVTETVVYTDGNGKIISEKEAKEIIARINKWKEEAKEQERITVEQEKQQEQRKAFEDKLTVQNLGFINCDKFPDEPMRAMQAKADERYMATYYLVYRDVRGLMQGHQYGKDVNFGNVPKNKAATLVAVAFNGKDAYFAKMDIAPNTTATPQINLQPVSESFVNQELALLK